MVRTLLIAFLWLFVTLKSEKKILQQNMYILRCLKNTRDLDIFDFVSFRSCNKSLRNFDYWTLDVPFKSNRNFEEFIFYSDLSPMERTTSQHWGF